MCSPNGSFNIFPSCLVCFEPFKQAALLGIGLIKLGKLCEVFCEEGGGVYLVSNTGHWLPLHHVEDQGHCEYCSSLTISSGEHDKRGNL